MEVSKERLEEILNNLCAWALEHSEEFVNDFVYAGDFTSEEAKKFGVD